MTPRHMLRHSIQATSWKFIVEIIRSGKHPSKIAMAMALGGPKPMPKAVREYLAKRLECGWPRGEPTKTPWEKMEAIGLNREGEERGKFDQILSAALEVEQRWMFCKYCKYRRKGMGPREAVTKTYTSLRKMPQGWPALDESDVTYLVLSFGQSKERGIKKNAVKKFGDIIREVSDQESVSEDRLAEFFRNDIYRYDFR